MNVPEQMQGSGAIQLVIGQGWEFKVSAAQQIELKCPYCAKDSHCRMEIHGSNSEQKQRDGLHICMRCGKSNNLYALKQHLGIITPGVSSQKDWASSEKKVDPLPDLDACHTALLGDDDALDYLCNVRGFSLEIVKKQKLGVTEHYFKETGKVKALVFPYLVNGQQIWCHYRTLPDPNDLKKVPKAFSSPSGYESALYNGEILKEGLSDVLFVEGECDALIAMDKGITNVVAVPGASMRRAEWLSSLDKIGLEKIFICYDADKTGQKAAQVLASKIGIERCWKITLPDFKVTTEDGIERKGKDLNEWFNTGGTVEDFELLKSEATLFDVDGVASTCDAVDEFVEELEGKGAGQKYVWPLIKDLAQFDEGDCIMLLGPEKQGKSTVGLNLIEYMVDTYQENGAIVCLEMTRAKLARKWIAHKAGIPDNLPKTPEEAVALTQLFKDAIPGVKELAANRPGDLLFCYPKYSTEDDIYKLIIDIIRRYGAKWIMVDNLQLLCDTTIKGRNRTQHLSEISKRLTKIGKDYNCQMVIILQPHRIAENRLATSDSVDGASQVAKDCDVLLTINRNRVGEVSKETFASGAFIQSDCTFGPEMLMTAGLSRYSAGGSKLLYFDGATSTVHQLNEGKVKSMIANTGNGLLKDAGTAPGSLEALTKAVTEDDVVI